MKTLKSIHTEKIGDTLKAVSMAFTDGDKAPEVMTIAMTNDNWAALRNELHMSVEVIEK